MKTVKIKNMLCCETENCKFNDNTEYPKCTRKSIKLLDYKDKQLCNSFEKRIV